MINYLYSNSCKNETDVGRETRERDAEAAAILLEISQNPRNFENKENEPFIPAPGNR